MKLIVIKIELLVFHILGTSVSLTQWQVCEMLGFKNLQALPAHQKLYLDYANNTRAEEYL